MPNGMDFDADCATIAVVASEKATPVAVPAAPTAFCVDSRPQMCRMMCQPPSCPTGQCAMRSDSCCEFTCQAPADATETAVPGPILDGGFDTGVLATGQSDPTAPAGYNCCCGGAACGFEHCPALGAGQAGCVRRWSMPNGMDFDADCATIAVVASEKATPVAVPAAPTAFCVDSRPQMCRMMCQPPSCPTGHCLAFDRDHRH